MVPQSLICSCPPPFRYHPALKCSWHNRVHRAALKPCPLPLITHPNPFSPPSPSKPTRPPPGHPHPQTTTHPFPAPPFHLIRSSSVARHRGLFLHSTDTWQTNECSFVWRDPPQIAPKMHHTGICLFFCIFNESMCVSRLSVLFCSVLVKRNKGTSSLPSAAYK